MRETLLRGGVFALLTIPGVGCTSGVEPAPEGYHQEWVNNGKRRELVNLPDDPSVNKPITVVVRTLSDQPGPGDYYIYVTEGKRVSRVLVHNEEVKQEPQVQWIEVNPERICPNCKPYYKLVGKQMERGYYCNASVHVDPGPKKES
jgi:hypothetical protein